MTLSLDSRIALDPHARFRRFEEEGIVIQQTHAEAIVVNEVATRLLELTDGERTLRACAELLADEFDAPAADIANDVLTFASELADGGVVRIVDGAR